MKTVTTETQTPEPLPALRVVGKANADAYWLLVDAIAAWLDRKGLVIEKDKAEAVHLVKA